MTDKKILIKVKSDGKILNAVWGNIELNPLDEVLFETDQGGTDLAWVLPSDGHVDENALKEAGEATIIRKLTEKDQAKVVELKEEAKATIERCRDKIQKHNLEMTVVDADLSYDGKKLTFYFVAPGRVDFRSLVSDLASTFQKLIRLQQVGARDRVKSCGGCGRCGQEVCCKRFLRGDLESVTMDMAYDQNLAQMGSNRVTGACGKLMCCLKFELEVYKKSKDKLPKLGEKYKTKEGVGIVVSQNVILRKISVELDDKNIVEVSC